MNVLILDDNKEIVRGMQYGLDWKRLQVDRVFGANSAATAREIIHSETIDVMLCDIEMPGENGIELIRSIREEGYDFEVIFLTSHAVFDYAREVVSLNAFDYMLQPVRYEKIEEKLENALEKRRKSLYREAMQKKAYDANQAYAAMADSYLAQIMRSPQAAENYTRKLLQIVGISADDAKLYLTVISVFRNEKTPAWEETLIRGMIQNVLRELMEEEADPAVMCLGGDKYAVLTALRRGVTPERIRHHMEEYLHFEEESLPFRSAFFFIGKTSIPEFGKDLSRAVDISRRNLMKEAGFFNAAGETEQANPFSRETWISAKGWDKLFQDGKGEMVIRFVEEYFEKESNKRNVRSFDYIQNEFIVQYLSVFVEKEIPIHEVLSAPFTQKEFISPSDSYEGFHRKMEEAVRRLNDYMGKDSAAENKKSDQIIRYIRDHIGEKVNRDEIARAMGFHKDSLTRLFKAETGYGLKEYILMEKIEYAKYLLKSTDKPVGEIAMDTGFDNFSHFSQAFKKIEGVSPYEYKNRNEKEDL